MTGVESESDGRKRRRVPDERILDAAAAEFAAHGFAGASMAAVAVRAGTTKPTLYANFGPKDDLYAATVRAETAALSKALLATYATVERDGPREQLHVGTRAIFTYAAERPDGFELLFGAGPGIPLANDALREGYEQVVGAVAAMVAPRLADGDPRHARLIATMLVGLLHAAARTAVADGIPPGAAAAVAESLVLGGLTGLDLALLADV